MSIRRSSRTPAGSLTATTLFVLVAMSAASGTGVPETRAMHGESSCVRTMAAAVAAVARDMIGLERTASTAVIVLATPIADAAAVRTDDDASSPPHARRLLAERLLDLPPPLA